MSSVEAVIFAIRAGLKVYGAARTAHANATKAKPLILPLPQTRLPVNGAKVWFRTNAGKRAREEAGGERLEFLLKHDPVPDTLQPELNQIYNVLRAIYDPEGDISPGDGDWSSEEIMGVLDVRQWSIEGPSGDPSGLQVVAGTLVNLAVDYFASNPGAVDLERPEGRAVSAFLEAIESVDFSKETLGNIAPGLFVAMLDSVAANPGLLGSGPKERSFVTQVTKSLSETITEGLEGTTGAQRLAFFGEHWPELIARAFFKGGAETILAYPRTYLGTGGDESRIVKALISTFTSLALTETGVDLRAAVSQEGMEQIVKATLAAIAENPGFIELDDDLKGLEKLIEATIAALPSEETILSQDLVPRVVELVLRNSAANLALIVKHDGKNPKKNLIILASETLLTALADNSTKGWNPPLTQTQVTALLDVVAAEVLNNPDWVLRQIAGKGTMLRVALDAAAISLREHASGQEDGHLLLTNEVMLDSLQASIVAASTNLTLVKELAKLDGSGKAVALGLVLDLILITLSDIPATDDETRWRLASSAAAGAIIEIALRSLARHDASKTTIDVLRLVLDDLVAGKIRLQQLADELERRLSALPAPS